MQNALPSRREMLQAAAAVAAAAVSAAARDESAPSATEPARSLCYVDGYHGGIDGHMPPGSLHDVMNGLETFPHWKVTFEIEPYSWAVFAKSDPPSMDRLRQFLADSTPAARVELISGAYGQPYMWNISGESAIRHLMRGREEIRAVFPDVRVDTYAVQEPCWTSCLPALLTSMGYRQAVLKNSTCWGGYHAPTIDADLINWTAPDGSFIAAVPRYACEKLVPPASEESAQPPAGFVERCQAAGIAHPAGTILQDMGWPGRPWRLGLNEGVFHSLKYVTWREYVEKIADAPTTKWQASQEDVRAGLAWGAPVLQRIAQIVRASENLVSQAEKLATMAHIRKGAAIPADDLRRAWTNLLLSQHHDVWIVPYNHHHGGTWASEVDTRYAQTMEICGNVIRDAAGSMSGDRAGGLEARQIRVFNTTGFRRRDIAAVNIPGDQAMRVLDAKGKSLPVQVLPGPFDKNSVRLLFEVDTPAFGYTTCRMEPAADVPATQPAAAASVTTRPDGSVVLETDLYSLMLDPARGGRISSLIHKESSREIVDLASPRGFNEIRGFFPNENQWLSSTDAAATIKVIEPGPLRLTVKISGLIGAYPFTTVLTMEAGQRRIDFATNLQFSVDGGNRKGSDHPQHLRIGDPVKKGDDANTANRRPFYDSSHKVQALFPTALRQPKLYKNAAFDVCQSDKADTQFDSWDTIKHNVIVNWVDVMDADGAMGLAVLSDQTTAYSHGNGEPLGIVLCYAGPGTWFDYPLDRSPAMSYSIVPHAGDWSKAQLWRELAKWSEPVVATLTADTPGDEADWSLLDLSHGSVEVVAVYTEQGSTFARLFNASRESVDHEIRLLHKFRKVELTELDNRVIATLPINGASSGSVKVSFPRFGVRTLRMAAE